MKVLKLVCLLLLSAFSQLCAQITLTAPLNNAVYQRNSASQANLIINGTYNYPIVTSVQARLINPNTSNPIAGFDWTIIKTNPTNGHFEGALVAAPAGWHTLEVRVLLSGNLLASTSINRVGIGDVFMIAGQSNGQGFTNNAGLGDGIAATDPRVVTHNSGTYCTLADFPFPAFTQILSTTKPSSAGRDAWCYGKLGDLVVGTTGYPVAFFNSGVAGSSTNNWKVSSDGLSTYNPFATPPSVYCEEEGLPGIVGMPYLNFKRGLNYYNSMFGARAVLWHQGESDRFLGVSQTTYQDNLSYVINKSRTDYNSNLPWVVSRVSYEQSTTSAAVIAAQNNMPTLLPNIYLGPETDGTNNNTLANSRDGINLHFRNPVGLIALANLWSAYLNPTFFSNAQPIAATSPPIVSSSIVSNTSVMLSVPSGYTNYKWIRTDISGNSNIGNASEGSSNTLTKSTGTYQCWVTGSNGNLQISGPVNVNNVLALGINGGTCSVDQYLSDFKFSAATNAIGPVEINKTNGDSGDGDGVAIVLKGTSYTKGIGMAANGEIEYKIPSGQFCSLSAKLGIGDEISSTCNNTGGVVFKIYGNGNLVYTSSTVFRNTAVINLNLNISSYTTLKLRVEEVGSSAICNKAVWADLKLSCIAGDVTPPTVPTNLAVSDTSTLCLTYTWTASTDNSCLQGYRVYNGGTLLATLASGVTTYTVTGLSGGSTVNFKVEAFDLSGNTSAQATLTANTVVLQIDYPFFSDFCINTTYLPSIKKPSGGTFTLLSPLTATLNASTGAFNSPVPDLYTVSYSVGSIPACVTTGNFLIRTNNIPSSTPTLSADKSTVNIGTSVNLTSTACTNPSIFSWNNNASTFLNLTVSINDTTTYQTRCRINQCFVFSNTKTINVIPNCKPVYNLSSPANNLGNNINPIILRASQSITAANQIGVSNNLKYKAANSVLLLPGFKVDSGVIFTANIENCPN